MDEIDEIQEICSTYNKIGKIKETAEELGISWNRVVKILTTEGYVLNDRHEKILALHKQGKSLQEIAEEVELSTRTVQSYLPAKRPYYKYNFSANALRVRKCRENKAKNKT